MDENNINFQSMPKKKGLSWIVVVIVLLLVGALVGATIYYLYSGREGDVESIPELVEDTGFQASIRKEELKLANWRDGDSEKFYELKAEGGVVTNLIRGVNYLYAEEDMTLGDVLWHMDLSGEKNALVAHFDSGQYKYVTYPEYAALNPEATVVLDDPDSFVISAGTGIMVLIDEAAEAYGLYDSGRQADGVVVCDADVVNQGWNIVSIHDENIWEAIDPCGGVVNSMYLISEGGYDEVDNYDEFLEIEDFLAWVYYAEEPVVEEVIVEDVVIEEEVEEEDVIEEEVGADERGFYEASESSLDGVNLALSPVDAGMPGCEERVINILIDTKGQETTAVDAKILFNPDEVEVLEVVEGELFDFYPGKQVQDGVVLLTGANFGGPYATQGDAEVFGSLRVKSKAGVGEASLNFDFTLGQTVDSNVSNIAGSEDLLEMVGNGSYSFEGGCE